MTLITSKQDGVDIISAADMNTLVNKIQTTNATNVDWNITFPRVFNVRNYGAAGDGTTDDTNAFSLTQNAMLTGGIMYVPPGTYRFGGPFGVALSKAGTRLVISKGSKFTVSPGSTIGQFFTITNGNIEIDGGGSIFDAVGGATVGSVFYIVNVAGSHLVIRNFQARNLIGGSAADAAVRIAAVNVTTEDVTIENVSAATTSFCGVNITPFGSGVVRDFAIRNVRVTNPSYIGIFLNGSYEYGLQDFTVENCYVRGSGNNGIEITNAKNFSIISSKSLSNSIHGIDVVYSNSFIISSCHASLNGNLGIVTSVGCDHFSILGNVSIGNGNTGIDCDVTAAGAASFAYGVVSANICDGALTDHGIAIVGAKHMIVEGNFCRNNLGSGISISNSDFALVNGNQCWGSPNNGINVYGTSASAIIEGNDVRGNAATAISLSSPSKHVVRFNAGYNPVGIATFTINTSPYTYTNNDGVPEYITVYGGTVSSFVRDGFTVGSSSPFSTWLEPGQKLKMIYSVTPSGVKDRK